MVQELQECMIRRGSLEELDESFRSHTGSTKQPAESAFGEFLVIGNREAGDVAGLHENHVAASLAGEGPAVFLKGG